MSESELRTGRVLRADARVCHVEIDGRIVVAALRGKLFEERGPQKNPIAVGDFVKVDLSETLAAIDAVLPRRNRLGRCASSHDPREQVLVANVDRLFVVGSIAKPKFSSGQTDRMLAACAWYEVPGALILNKVDLARAEDVAAVAATYRGAGFEVLETSATERIGLDELRARLAGKVSAFYGASGVGKSTLLNALQPGLGLKVGKISKYWDAGKHTTAFSQLHALDFGGFVIDTPGIRVFRLHEAKASDLRGLFPEFERFQGECRFPSCTHDHEPDCAVFDAVERGEIAPSRYASYVEMLDELRKAPGAAADAGEDEGDGDS
jgi:ribosome biogenesis GTPase